MLSLALYQGKEAERRVAVKDANMWVALQMA